MGSGGSRSPPHLVGGWQMGWQCLLVPGLVLMQDVSGGGYLDDGGPKGTISGSLWEGEKVAAQTVTRLSPP